MLFWLGAGADGAGAVVLAVVVVVVVLGVVVVEGLVGLFPPQPAVTAPCATTSAGRSLLGAVLRRPGSSNMRRSRASAQLQTPVRAHGRHIPEGISQPLQSFEIGRA